MRSDRETARIFGGTPGPAGAFLQNVFDAKSGQYLSLVSRDRAIAALHAQGLTGQGVTAVIVDSGLWLRHPRSGGPPSTARTPPAKDLTT